MPASLWLSWREGVAAEPGAAGELCVTGPAARVVLRRLAPASAEALGRLAPPGDDEDRLADSVLDAGGPEALAGWHFTLRGLAKRGLVARSVRADGRRLATLIPASPSFELTTPPPAAGRVFLLSRFAYLRREGEELVLESPRAHRRIVFDDGRGAAVVGALATAGTAAEIAQRSAGLPADAVPPLLTLMAAAGMLAAAGPGGDEDRPPLLCWEFHDLLFHARSRKGRSDAPFGASYRLAGRCDPPPALKPEATGEAFALHRPDLARLEHDDPPLARVMESRRSQRDYGPEPISARQLGEFLYRVARVKEVREDVADTPDGPVPQQFATRPYPSGGCLYELEFYVAVQSCAGLEPGLYHYEGGSHRLARLDAPAADVGRLLADAAASAAVPAGRPQVLVVVAARFPRLAWKYASIAYALMLKHVGVVYQSMYLAATAMGLAPCALGGGDSDVFARAAGLDYDAETSVGEFLLGSAAPPAGAAG